ncbi:MAG: hypothetical protein Q4D77_08925, partial [Peptostreptococcaceae bacterium]|nr:hypothetical protein [Peptostreptococcaceae bacterium]
ANLYFFLKTPTTILHYRSLRSYDLFNIRSRIGKEARSVLTKTSPTFFRKLVPNCTDRFRYHDRSIFSIIS